MNEEILNVIRERGLLLEKEIFELFKNFSDVGVAKDFLIGLEQTSGQKIINKGVLTKNVEFVKGAVSKLPGDDKNYVEKVFVKLGISLEIQKEERVVERKDKNELEKKYEVVYSETRPDKKIGVQDFVGNFRARYQSLQRILMRRPELTNLVSINKISGDRRSLSLIGIVSEKRITKNKNMIIKFEDLTGEINALVKADNLEVFEKADELQMDDVVAIKASGNSDMVFIHDIFFPDSFIHERMKFDEDMCIAFISDIHCGSDKYLKKSFDNFIKWLNSGDETAKKIKYLFIVGDNVDGVGIFPGQEDVLELKSMKEQYDLLASSLEKVPKKITMFMCPGQHDATRVAEPQPLIMKRYAERLYDIDNLVLVTNPARVKLLEGNKEFKILMYHGASMHTFINEIKELRLMKAHRCPAKAIRHMLKRRHLAPMYGVSNSVVCVPNPDRDALVIDEVPDILCTGEVHKMDIENYNGVLIITGSCWQGKTPFEEKVGNLPDPGKVAVLNLKSRELRLLDFLDEEDREKAEGKTEVKE